mgnify:FL=1
MKVIDNFLPIDVFQNIHREIMGDNLTWLYRPNVAREDDKDELWNYFHSHLAYDEDRPWSTLYDIVFPFIEQVHQVEPLRACMRIMANAYPHTPELKLHQKHTDFDFSHKGAILYLNTCDGYTWCQGEKVYSVANRVLLHDPSIAHYSTTTTTDKRRVIVNLNYI